MATEKATDEYYNSLDYLRKHMGKELDLCTTSDTSFFGEFRLPVYVQRPKKETYKMNWGIFWQTDSEGTGLSLLEMAKSKELTLTDYRIRDYLFCKCSISNSVSITQASIVKDLNISQPNVSNSIKKLIKLGVISRDPENNRLYMINPAIMYCGAIGKGIHEREEAISKRKVQNQFIPEND